MLLVIVSSLFLIFQCSEKSECDTTEAKSKAVPSITLSRASEDNLRSLGKQNSEAEFYESGSPNSSPTQSPEHKRSPEGTDPETSDWLSQSSSSPISSSYNLKQCGQSTPEVPQEVEDLIKETISRQVEEHINPLEEMYHQESQSPHRSRIPVRATGGHTSTSSAGREEVDGPEQGVSGRKISIKVQRPRSPNSIMAEARARQEQEREKRKFEKEEQERQRKDEERERDEPVMTGSASEGGELETEPMKSDEDDIVNKNKIVTVNLQNSTQMNGEIHDGVPVFVMPGKTHDMELLLEALRHARNEASVQDQLMQNATPDNPEFKEVVHRNIEQLEAQLEAVKAQSKELFEDRAKQQETGRGRTSQREPGSAARNGRHSPPRGILDMMVNQNIHPSETSPKVAREETSSPHGILRNRCRSPTDHIQRFNEEAKRLRDNSHSPGRLRPTSPRENGSGDDADKRLIKFLTNEIENMKLKMAVMEQKSNQRSQSPYSVGPRISRGLPERERSPAQISSRARARFTTEDNSSRYSPARGSRSSELLDDYPSVSPRFGSPARSLSRSPARSPASGYRSRTPDKLSRERIRPISPSARVLSLQDLSTSINADIDGNLTFSPASGARPFNLGYSSPIRKVKEEIWGYTQTDDEYYADTAKYEGWKKLISRETVTDEDSLELKQALASALVELNIVQAKLKNANADIKHKMGKTTDVLNDCRAQISKSQAENAELRTQIEREKSKSDTQELRIKEMEKNMHSAKSNQDDKTLELEESVLTLKGKQNFFLIMNI